MKKVKKDKKSVGWKVVIGVAIVCVLAVEAYLWIGLRGELDAQLDWRMRMGQEIGQMQIARELKVSDDGRWLMMPEVRIRMPFFGRMGLDGEWGVIEAPRYNQYIWVTPEVAIAFNPWFDGSFWNDEEFLGQGCRDPFILRIDSDGTNEAWNDIVEVAKYKTFSEINLADGRNVKLQMRTAGPGSCMRYMEGTWGDQMKEALSKVESY